MMLALALSHGALVSLKRAPRKKQSRFGGDPEEGTGTRPDCLVNLDDQKNGGPFVKKKSHKNQEIVVE